MNLDKMNGHSILAAFKVLDIVIGKMNMEKLNIGVFDNCREQGFCITQYLGRLTTRVFFSEHRNSDMIVVYVDKDLPIGGGNFNNHPVDWDGKYFSYNEHKLAADYIIKQFGV